MELLKDFAREKRAYTKTNTDDWENTIFIKRERVLEQ